MTRSEVRGEEMDIEYRMARPFKVAIDHGLRQPTGFSEQPAVHVQGVTEYRKERVVVVSSASDFLRGEYYARLSLRRGSRVTIEANDRVVEVEPWSVADATGAKWNQPHEGADLGDGIGMDIVTFSTSPSQLEYLIVYAGTRVDDDVVTRPHLPAD